MFARSSVVTVLLLLFVSSCTSLSWESLTSGLEAWAALSFDANFAVNAGDERGTLYTWVSKNFSMSKNRLPGASLSKWPSAVMISGLVADGTMSYDDKANKYLRFWATDPKDPRSHITLRHLLTFTSGYSDDADPGCGKLESFEKCAAKLFKAQGKPKHAPGTHWAYLSCHLQFAGAMAVAASGKGIQALYKEYLYTPFNMTSTTWSPHRNPSIAAGITTTGDDFEQMLSRLLQYKHLPKVVQDQMETDSTQPPVNPSGDGWFGHYGMGHWWECLGYGTDADERAPLPKVCMDSHIQAGPGMYGFYPLLDRSHGGGAAGPQRPAFYFQVVLAEQYAFTGIPEYLRLAAKPLVDVILGQASQNTTRQALLDQGAGLLARDISYIEGSLGPCSCSKKPTAKGEPYASLLAAVPADEPKVNRRDLARKGQGILLTEIAAIQEKLGTCTCMARKA